MRKFVLSAIACVAFAGSSFASNEVVYEKQDLSLEKSDKLTIQESQRPCTVYVWVTAPDGERQWKTGEGGSLSWDDCGEYKDGFLNGLREQGFEFSEDDITVIWG